MTKLHFTPVLSVKGSPPKSWNLTFTDTNGVKFHVGILSSTYTDIAEKLFLKIGLVTLNDDETTFESLTEKL